MLDLYACAIREIARADPGMLACDALLDQDILEWKRHDVLKQHVLAHATRTCPRCHIPFLKAKLGHSNRRSFYCERCQERYIRVRFMGVSLPNEHCPVVCDIVNQHF